MRFGAGDDLLGCDDEVDPEVVGGGGEFLVQHLGAVDGGPEPFVSTFLHKLSVVRRSSTIEGPN